jgi:hypothetical protein
MEPEQLMSVLMCVAGVCLTFLFPPNDYSQQTYTFFWNIPEGYIDAEGLIVQLGVFLIVPSILFVAFRDKKDKTPKGEEKE